MAATSEKSKVRAPSPAPSSSSDASSASQSSVDSDDIDVAPVATTAKKPRKSKPGERLYYEPPPGMEQVRINVNYNSEFEWENLNTKCGLEVWAVRLPVDLKPSHLAGLSTSVKRDTVSGSLTHKSTTYELTESEDISDLNSLNLLVPKKSSGHLFRAPLPIKRHLILQPPKEDNVVSSSKKKLDSENRSTGPIPNKTRKMPSNMKFRNPVNGFDTPGPAARPQSREDMKETAKTKEEKTPKKEDKEKKKRRKSEAGESPAKKKKK